ncbi:hypothetical protein DSUL_50177 [Desulfovibrionales bacterium]
MRDLRGCVPSIGYGFFLLAVFGLPVDRRFVYLSSLVGTIRRGVRH